VSVPLAWDDVNGRPYDTGEPDLAAATDIGDFFMSYDVGGIHFTGFAAGSPDEARYFNPSSEVQMRDWLRIVGRYAGDRGDTPANACLGVDADDFSANVFTCLMETYTDCGKTGSDVVCVAAANANASVGIVVELIVVTGDEQAAVDAILDSLVADILT